jgi:hypothetical protein
MNLYKISQDDVGGWDTFDSAVVAAETVEAAKRIHPASYVDKPVGEKREYYSLSWTNDPEKVSCKFIGVAVTGTQQGVICASFNAG